MSDVLAAAPPLGVGPRPPSMTIPGPCTAGRADTALSLQAARLRALAAARPLREVETLPLLAARGRVLAGPAVAVIDLPPFDNSAMDGFAIHASDLSAGTLRVEGRVLAGDPPGAPLRAGSVRRIMTGAPVPPGTAAIVMQEHVRRDGIWVHLDAPVRDGANLRRRGEDQPAGAEALAAGHLLSPASMALLAGCGLVSVSVLRRLRVTLLSTGSELREPGAAIGPGQIVNTNRVLLAALLAEPWIDLEDIGIIADDPAAVRTAIREAAARSDVIVSSGGVSAGEADHVLDALQAEDAALDVLKVAIRPGKPLTVGRVGGALWVGLPGNPFAAAVTYTQVARPALWRTAGLGSMPDLWIPAVSGFDYERTTGRTEFVPVTWEARDALGRPILHRLGCGASASLRPLATARGLAAIPSAQARIQPGSLLIFEPVF